MNGLAVFDLDGTLVDTAPDLIDTTNVVLARRGVPAMKAADLLPHVGLGARAMIDATLLAAGITLPDAEIDACHAEFLSHYGERIAKLSRPFPEMLDALATLEGAGVGLAVCTNKREANAKALLSALGLLHRFRFVAGADTFTVSKPDPGHLTQTIDNAGGTADRTVYVGDSRVDVMTARAANVPIVGVTYGYTDVPMTALDPDRLLNRGDDVGAAILELMGCLTV